MGLYKSAAEQKFPDDLSKVAAAGTYTLYSRGGPWYVNFRLNGVQLRISTGIRDRDQAKALIEGIRDKWKPGGTEPVNEAHLVRMVERVRGKCRKKGIPLDLKMSYLREVVARCGGFCEVSGRKLENSGPFRPSLDRITPELGYVPGNVRIVCLVTNTAMLHYGEEAFAEIAIAYCQKRGIIAS